MMDPEGLPLDLPPGERRTLQVQCSIITQEKFAFSFPVFYDEGGATRSVEVNISGGEPAVPETRH